MNWFEHHIGDYDKNTSHLTACEDGIYCRLIRRYYDKERPLDADVTEVKRIARARTRDERAAVDAVLREFFHLEADGWHHAKCDEVIADYQAGEPEREAKKKNEDTRLARHRQERADLFTVINGAGLHMAWNCPIAELRATAERVRNGEAPEPATCVSRTTATAPATAPATPATATHPPPTTTHPPNEEKAKAPRKRVATAPFATAPTCPDDVDAQVWNDWLALRRGKRATVSDTVLTSARGEATKAGLTLEAFLRIWCLRGSQGLEASWIKPDERQRFAGQSFRERDADAAATRLAEFTGGLAVAKRPGQGTQLFEVIDADGTARLVG